ncbi:zinc-binding dehydrogenase [Phycicoccus sp. BSK3Z-2]|uniref:Zinc-binding dehydrogenase n=1 Tax=Phycicoccus avicenniae TaxID=2828860 RepID=A0A941D8V2_9MICO|nr:zinc-binding dehydrogenase [Phycicoccus avicenniae]MBR7743238.1 zinc-binding dehydrogenase [Phycicoccus avicenniae]
MTATVPTTMDAVLLTAHGGPEVLEHRRVPVPRPGPDEVLVRVAAAALNNTDVWTREGAYGLPGPRSGWTGPVAFPRIQGGDVAGRVAATGAEVDDGLLGARVLVDPALYAGDGPDTYPADVLGSERDGGYAQYCVVPASCAHRVDGSPLTDVELACLPIAYGTALGMVERGAVTRGDTVLVTGASGGVGLAAVQLCAARGARVVAVSSTGKTDPVRAAGADVVLDRRAGPVLDALSEAAPDGVDVAVDVVAGPTLAGGLDLLRDGGRWVVAGALDGAEVTVDVRRLYLRNRRLVGSTMHTPAVFERLVGIARRGEVRPVVAATYPLVEAAGAQRDLEARRHVGKLVLLP